jgi:hypothetical protein
VWLALGVFVLHAGYLAYLRGPYCVDDAYISFRYAASFLDGQGLVFNAGERVEGYTNFGWVMVISGLLALGLDPAWSARAASLLLGAAVVWLTLRFIRARSGSSAAVWIAAGLLVTDGTLVIWAQDGMETIFFGFLVLLGAALLAGELARLEAGEPPGAGSAPSATGLPWWGLALGLATLTRPEGGLVFATGAAFAAAWGLTRGQLQRALLVRRLALSGAVYLALVLPWFLWRWTYYDALLPNTFYAKVGSSGDQVLRGLRYAGSFLVPQHPGLLALLLVAAATGIARRAGLALWEGLFLTLAGVFLLYVVAVGGDWMGPSRFFVPIVLLLYPVLAARLAAGLSGVRAPLARRAAWAGVALLVACQLVTTTATGIAPNAHLERERGRGRRLLASWLRAHAEPGDTLLATEIGQLAWESRLRVLDLHGLTDPYIARLEVESIGRGRAGHEKKDLAYSFSKRPDWVWMPQVEIFYANAWARFPPLREYELVRVTDPADPTVHRSFRYVLRRKKPTGALG